MTMMKCHTILLKETASISKLYSVVDDTGICMENNASIKQFMRIITLTVFMRLVRRTEPQFN